jgi:hypothetical protein
MWTSAPGELLRRALLTGEPSNVSVPDCPSGPTYDSKLLLGSLYPLLKEATR